MSKLTKADFIAKGFCESMAAHLERHQRAAPKPMTPERILQITKSNGRFDASLRYRDDKLRGMCAKLKRKGLLSGGQRLGGYLIYELTEAGQAAINGAQ